MAPALHRPKSSLGLRTEQDLALSPLTSIPFGSMTRGKSLPSIHIDITAQIDPAAAQVALKRERHNSSMEHLHRPSAAPPTITVTEHSPVSSIQFFINQVSLSTDTLLTSPKIMSIMITTNLDLGKRRFSKRRRFSWSSRGMPRKRTIVLSSMSTIGNHSFPNRF